MIAEARKRRRSTSTERIETIRGLLLGTPLGWNPVLAIGWSIGIVVLSYVWSRALYERKSVR